MLFGFSCATLVLLCTGPVLFWTRCNRRACPWTPTCLSYACREVILGSVLRTQPGWSGQFCWHFLCVFWRLFGARQAGALPAPGIWRDCLPLVCFRALFWVAFLGFVFPRFVFPGAGGERDPLVPEMGVAYSAGWSWWKSVAQPTMDIREHTMKRAMAAKSGWGSVALHHPWAVL